MEVVEEKVKGVIEARRGILAGLNGGEWEWSCVGTIHKQESAD